MIFIIVCVSWNTKKCFDLHFLLQSCHVYFGVLLINFISTDILYLFSSLIAQDSHPYNKMGNTKVLYIFSLVCFWT